MLWITLETYRRIRDFDAWQREEAAEEYLTWLRDPCKDEWEKVVQNWCEWISEHNHETPKV
jgi:hypothetical protein